MHLKCLLAALIAWKVTQGFRWWPDRPNRRMHLNPSLVPISIEWNVAPEMHVGCFDCMESYPRMILVA
jgi:hypothetical protein